MVSSIGSPQITPNCRSCTPAGQTAGGKNAPETTLVGANAHREATGDLSIVTREGDMVTISAHLEADATFAGVRTRGASATYLSLETQSSLEIQVQGDLSEEEMADIQKLVKQFSRELRQFFRGSEGADANDVGKGNFSSLTGFAVHYDASASLTVIAAVAQPVASPSESPGNPAGELEGEQGEQVSGQLPAVAAEPEGVDGRALSELIGRLVHMTRRAGVEGPRLGDMIGDLLDQAARPFEGKKDSHVLDYIRREVERGVREPGSAQS